LSRRIDVVGCGNALRKEGRKERKNKLMWVAAMQHHNNRGLFCDPHIIANNKERSF